MTTHYFGCSGEAYDACQCREDIKSGDILVIEGDEDNAGVIGIADTWPIAITEESGAFHQAHEGELRDYLAKNKLDANIHAAIALANEKGFALLAELVREAA